MDDAGHACIADFGLSKIVYSALSRTTVRSPSSVSLTGGTLRFMSPEQFRGKITKASDVYSYSMTLYEVCHYSSTAFKTGNNFLSI